ncbi:hypothetical protein D9M70_414870 [compost metagenome]
MGHRHRVETQPALHVFKLGRQFVEGLHERCHLLCTLADRSDAHGEIARPEVLRRLGEHLERPADLARQPVAGETAKGHRGRPEAEDDLVHLPVCPLLEFGHGRKQFLQRFLARQLAGIEIGIGLSRFRRHPLQEPRLQPRLHVVDAGIDDEHADDQQDDRHQGRENAERQAREADLHLGSTKR